MGRVLEAIRTFFDADSWPYKQLEEQLVFKTGFNGDNAEFNCYAQDREALEQFVFYSVFPVKVPEDKRTAAAEFITRANYGLIIGNFEFDYEDGEVRYKTSADLEGVPEIQPMMKGLIYSNVLTMDKYFPGLMRVIYGGISAQEALAEVEEA